MEFDISNLKVGIVTVTYNSENVIEGFMRSLFAQTHENFRLYIIDNASSDKTIEIISNCYNDSRIITISNGGNLGVAEGNNQGINAAIKDCCEKILLINNDTEFEDRLISKLLQGLSSHFCEIVVPKIMYFDNPQKIWCAGGYFRKLTAYQGLHYGLDEIDNGQYNISKLVMFSPTCCMMINAQVFQKIGLMDEKYFVYHDDCDFCLRAYKEEIKMFYLPNVYFLHKVSSLTGGKTSDFSIRYSTRNYVYYIKKHQSFPMKIFFLALYATFLHLKFILLKDNLEVFNLKKASFIEGLYL
jgi:GT2 family glycosyltransferase